MSRFWEALPHIASAAASLISVSNLSTENTYLREALSQERQHSQWLLGQVAQYRAECESLREQQKSKKRKRG